MVAYFSILNVKKVITNKEPEYLYTKIMRNSATHDYGTRANTGTNLRVKDIKLGIAKNSFRWRATDIYNKIPRALKEGPLTESVKREIKLWVSKNVEVNINGNETRPGNLVGAVTTTKAPGGARRKMGCTH